MKTKNRKSFNGIQCIGVMKQLNRTIVLLIIDIPRERDLVIRNRNINMLALLFEKFIIKSNYDYELKQN